MTTNEALAVAADLPESPAMIMAALETLAARVRELESAGVSGHCVKIGDDDSGQPCVVIHTTREEIKHHGHNLLFQKVKVRAA